jgi:quercetin dioxygenase-like cupin family protein
VSSRVVRGAGLRWPAVAVRAYQEESARTSCEVSRRVLAGREAGDDLQFEVRYFELLPGGATSYERHQHPHAVVVLAGRGQVRLGDERHEIEVSDVVYVAPGECHQFLAAADERLGILCVVDEERDRPEPVPEATE